MLAFWLLIAFTCVLFATGIGTFAFAHYTNEDYGCLAIVLLILAAICGSSAVYQAENIDKRAAAGSPSS